MLIWIVEASEPLPAIDGSFRDLRCGMLSKSLVAHGHTVVWWSSTFDHMKKRHRFEGPRSIEVQFGLHLNLLQGPGYQKNVSLSRIHHHRSLARAFEQESYHYQPEPDLLFACLPIPELAEKAAVYGQARHIPVVIDVRDQWPDLYLAAFPSIFRRAARLALAFEFQRARRIFRAATAITAVSETYLKWALDYAGRPRRETDSVFPLGYSMPAAGAQIETQAAHLQAKYGIRPGSMVVTFVGMFGASSDLETVVEAARVLQADGISDTQIVLAGDGDTAPQLREKARNLKNVTFTGWLDQISILALMRLSQVGLVAYRKRALQSLPNKPFEYMAAGLPLLSSLHGELESLLHEENVGIQYRAEDVASLVDGIHWLEAHPDERKTMGLRARRLFEEKFNSEVVYPCLVRHLEKVALQKRAT